MRMPAAVAASAAAQSKARPLPPPAVLRLHRVAVPGKRGTDGYRNEFADIAKGFALLGATQRAIGDLFGVDEETVRLWKRAHPKFRKALDEGAIHADGFVAHAFYRRCVGYDIASCRRHCAATCGALICSRTMRERRSCEAELPDAPTKETLMTTRFKQALVSVVVVAVIVGAAPSGARADNTASQQPSSNLDPLLEEQRALLEKYGLAPIIVSRGERVGDTFDSTTLRLIAGVDDCFPSLAPRKVPAQLPSVTGEKGQGLAAALGVANVADAEGNADAVTKYELTFSNVQAVTASMVQLRTALRSGVPECEALRRYLAVTNMDGKSIEPPDNAPVLIGTLFMAKRTVRITLSSKASAKVSFGERILKWLGIGGSFQARASGNKSQEDTIELIGNDVIPVAFSAAFQIKRTVTSSRHPVYVCIGPTCDFTWVETPIESLTIRQIDIHSQSFIDSAGRAFKEALHN
jgi:hypothetical protein